MDDFNKFMEPYFRLLIAVIIGAAIFFGLLANADPQIGRQIAENAGVHLATPTPTP